MQLRFVVSDCVCRPGEPYVDGHRPEFETSRAQATQKFIQRYNGNRVFWGVHLRGEHILNVFIDGEPVREIGPLR